jgi:hypothetical protein
MPTPNLIDIAGSLQGQVTVTPEEHPDERALRIATARRQGVIEDCKGIAVFAVLLVAIVAIGSLAAYEGVFDSGASVDTRKWAQTLLVAVLTGGISFVVGRKVGGKPT